MSANSDRPIINYRKLWDIIKQRNIKKTDLQKSIGISSSTLYKIHNNEYISLEILVRISVFLNCEISDMLEIEKDNK